MKKLIFVLILLNIIFISHVKAIDTSEKIYDYSDFLTDSEEQLLKDKIDTFIDTYNMDMVLVTVDSHNSSSTMNYADDFYDYNGFGVGIHNDGLIFVIDNNFSKENLWISTTGEAIRMYDDYRIDKILDAVYDEYNYYELFDKFIDECSYYASLGIPSSNKNTYINQFGDLVRIKHFPYIVSIGISGLVATIVLLVLIHKNKMIKKATDANVYMNKEDIKITERSDQFITTNTTRVRINTSSGGSGGSSTHHGSSGISHGGGGRSR